MKKNEKLSHVIWNTRHRPFSARRGALRGGLSPPMVTAAVVSLEMTRLKASNSSCVMRQNMFEEAVEAFSKAVEMNSSDVRLYNYLGICHRRMKRYPQAVENRIEVEAKRGDGTLFPAELGVSDCKDWELFPEYHARLFREADERVRQSGQPLQFEEEAGVHGGKAFFLTTKFPLFDEERNVYAVGGIATDITGQKRIEEELRRSKSSLSKAQEIAQAGNWDWNIKSGGMYWSSQAYRNFGFEPGAVSPTYQLMVNTIHPNDQNLLKKTKELVTHGLDGAGKMLALIEEILNISRLQSGTMQLNRKFVDANYIAIKAVSTFLPIAEKKGINIVNNIPRHARIYADDALITEVVNNLVSNAVKFCRTGGEITLFMHKDHPSTLAIKDTGMGIEPKRLDELFRYEVKTSTVGTAGERGTGFGLPLSNDIVKAHGGGIRVVFRAIRRF